MLKPIWLACISVIILSLPTISFAAKEFNTIEIPYTLPRRIPEDPQKIPASVSVIEEKTIEKQGLKNTSRLGEIAPNLTLDFTAPISGSSNAASIYIRGVGQSDFLLVNDPGVGVYQDGIYISRSVGSLLNLNQVQAISVVRGPQGTLFGRNSIGGAINIIIKKPQPRKFGEASLSTGNLGQLNSNLFYNNPLIENRLLSSFLLSTEKRDGYVDRLIAGDTSGGIDRKNAQLKLSWVGTDNLDVDFALEYQHANDEGSAIVGRWTGDPTLYGRGSLTDLYNTFVAPTNTVSGFGVGIPYDSRFLTYDPYKTYGTGPNFSEYEIWGSSLIADYQSDQWYFKSLTGYRHTNSRFGRDPDASPITIIHTQNDYQHQQFSQEFQLSTHINEQLNWLTGLYFFHETGKDEITAPFVQGLFGAIGLPTLLFGRTEINTQNLALYTHLTYQIANDWELSGGIRYNHEEKKLDASFIYLDANLNLLANPKAKESYDDITEHLTLSYQASQNLKIYTTYATGFKSGGFTGRYVAPTAAPLPFEPEKLTSYEAGFKSSWLTGRLNLNGALFYSDYKDIQILIFNGIAPETRNAARGHIKGAELELQAYPAHNWEISLAAGYLDAQYTELDASTGSLSVPLNKSDQFVNTPEWSASLGVTYHFRINDYKAMLYGNYSYRSKVANDAINTPELIQPALSLYNASATLQPNNEKWGIALYGNNLTDQRYIVSGAADKATFGAVGVVYAPPREYGIELTYRF
jgi:iron complex outermembrane recepter protein